MSGSGAGRDAPAGAQRGERRRLFWLLSALALAAFSAVLWSLWPDPLADEWSALVVDEDIERAPGPAAQVGTPPGGDASAEELWRYGERFLGWTPRAEVDLSTYTPEELRGWISQDLRLRGNEDSLDDGLEGDYFDGVEYVE